MGSGRQGMRGGQGRKIDKKKQFQFILSYWKK
jgi:hypothetical protein